jgi:hypothetical protein
MNTPKRVFAALIGFSFALIATVYAQAPVAEESPKEEPTRQLPVAQPPVADKAPATKVDPKAQRFCQCVGEPGSAMLQRINFTLEHQLHAPGFDYVETPLQDVVNSMSEDYGIPIQLDKPALEEVGVGTDVPVTINLHNVSLKAALRHMLRDYQLAYVIRDEMLVITTAANAQNEHQVCVYDVRDLVDAQNERPLSALAKTLEEIIRDTDRSEQKPGQIRSIEPSTLIVSLPRERQETFRELLAIIREMNGERHSKSGQSEHGGAEPHGKPAAAK